MSAAKQRRLRRAETAGTRYTLALLAAEFSGLCLLRGFFGYSFLADFLLCSCACACTLAVVYKELSADAVEEERFW